MKNLSKEELLEINFKDDLERIHLLELVKNKLSKIDIHNDLITIKQLKQITKLLRIKNV